jgi:4'-phosphopantetheinyl transferase
MRSREFPWSLPPRRMRLDRRDVHVWRVALEQPPLVTQSLWRILTPDEKGRAERYHFRRDRDHFVVARGALRTILGRYLDTPPDRLRFRYGPYGKPALSSHGDAGALRFNISHSHGLALCAVTRGREIGVDVEHVREEVAGEEIAEQFFSRREVATLRALPPHMRAQGFFNCWTRKEAYIKARGEGLSLPLDEFDVSLSPGEPAALLGAREKTHGAERWALRELAPGHGYVAAMAVEGHDWQPSHWHWQSHRPTPHA